VNRSFGVSTSAVTEICSKVSKHLTGQSDKYLYLIIVSGSGRRHFVTKYVSAYTNSDSTTDIKGGGGVVRTKLNHALDTLSSYVLALEIPNLTSTVSNVNTAKFIAIVVVQKNTTKLLL
jgi:hypothetical protein